MDRRKPAPSTDDPKRTTLKERARKARREVYLKAKERRANDPKQIAFKEAQRQRQRAAYQVAKERRRALIIERKRAQKESDPAPGPAAAEPEPVFPPMDRGLLH